MTRLNIAYSINILCQFLHEPPNDYMKVVKKVLRYLKIAITHGVTLISVMCLAW